jgi:hypothetical protein
MRRKAVAEWKTLPARHSTTATVIAPSLAGSSLVSQFCRDGFVPCLRDVDDEIGDQRAQFYYRWNFHKQRNIALHLIIIDFECRGFSNFEDAFAIPTNDYWQGHRQVLLEQVGDRRHPVVQDDVANFRQCFVLEIDDTFYESDRPVTARISSKLLVSGKVNSARPENAPVKS